MTKKIEDVMSKNLVVANKDITLKQAHGMMLEKRIRHLMITDQGTGKLLGLISDRDVKKFISPFASSDAATDRDKATLQIKVDKVMVKDVITAKLGDPLKAVIEKMLQKKISCTPVLGDGDKLVGVLTTTDAMKILVGML
jgi:acetoin utilization protein AcuB